MTLAHRLDTPPDNTGAPTAAQVIAATSSGLRHREATDEQGGDLTVGPGAAPKQPGWYRDLTDARRHRYWTGTQWLTQEDGTAHHTPL